MLVSEAEQLWTACVEAIRPQVSDATWKAWFDGVEPLETGGGCLRLAVPSALVKERLEGRYLGLLTDALGNFLGGEATVELVVHTAPPEGDTAPTEEEAAAGNGSAHSSGGRTGAGGRAKGPAGTNGAHARADGDELATPRLALNPRYTFERFVIGASNRFAHAAALSVAETPAKSYNPLFVHGEAGLGKTHLLHAIGHFVRQHHPDKSVRYVSTETFMNEFVDAIRTNTTPGFKRRYRECDVLLIDDIQFLENKEGTQEEFFHTFAAVYGAGGQIVISSDRHAKALVTLEERLRSRFLSGLITDVQPPDLETRLAILRKKAEGERVSVPDEVLELIATHVRNNIRELEGALIRVEASASLNHEPVDLASATRVLGDILAADEPRQITPQIIFEATAETFGFSVDELQGASRRRPLVNARQICMYVFRELTDYSYPAIAREFGGRDHTTVIHAVEKIAALMRERRQIFDQVNELMHRVRTGP